MNQITGDQDSCPERADLRCIVAPPLVSVVMPTYNRAHILPRAIRSVLNQDFADLELLVIDDGSTDDTAPLVGDLVDPRVRYTRFQVNRGIGAARHEGISRSRGSLIAFLDSDDSWTPGKLSKIVAAFTRHPQIDLVFSDFDNINYVANTRQGGLRTADAALRGLRISPLGAGWWAIEAGIPEALMRRNFIGTSSAVVARRSVFERAGNFRKDLSGPEDLEMWWRAALLGAQFAYTTDVLVERHKDARSITSQTLTFAPRMLDALNACEHTARRVGRLDLLRHVDQARSRTWSTLVETCAEEGNFTAACKAVRTGLPYLPLLSLRYVAIALAQPWLTSLARRLRRY